jgi:hypothetical protein
MSFSKPKNNPGIKVKRQPKSDCLSFIPVIVPILLLAS